MTDTNEGKPLLKPMEITRKQIHGIDDILILNSLME